MSGKRGADQFNDYGQILDTQTIPITGGKRGTARDQGDYSYDPLGRVTTLPAADTDGPPWFRERTEAELARARALVDELRPARAAPAHRDDDDTVRAAQPGCSEPGQMGGDRRTFGVPLPVQLHRPSQTCPAFSAWVFLL